MFYSQHWGFWGKPKPIKRADLIVATGARENPALVAGFICQGEKVRAFIVAGQG